MIVIEHVTDWKVRAEMLEAACRKSDDRVRELEREASLLRLEVQKAKEDRATLAEVHKELVDALKKAGVVA